MLKLLQIMWGEGFLSPGGPQAVRAIVEGLDLKDKAVLDIGCGLGGLDEVLAGEFGAKVIGVDVAKLVVQLGQERIAQSPLKDRIEIQLDRARATALSRMPVSTRCSARMPGCTFPTRPASSPKSSAC